MPVALDFEWPTSNGKPVGRMYEANLTQAEYTAICSTFCDTIAASGYTPMVYANSSDLKNTIDGAKLAEQYKIWLANYTTKHRIRILMNSGSIQAMVSLTALQIPAAPRRG